MDGCVHAPVCTVFRLINDFAVKFVSCGILASVFQSYIGPLDQMVKAILADVSSQQNDDVSAQAFSRLVCSQVE